MMIKATAVLLIFSFCLTFSEGQNLENLAKHVVNKEVQGSLATRLSSQVHRELTPLDNLAARISSNQVHSQLTPLENIAARLSGPIDRDLDSFDSLGERIKQEVYQNLKPVRILESIGRVKSGSDGTTIATFSPSGRRFLIRNSILYECTSTISDRDDNCSSDLKKMKFEKQEDFCFANSKSIINNWYCITSSNSIRSSYSNGKIVCDSGDGSPSLLIKANEYNSMCKTVATSVTYKYFTYKNLENIGNGLQCWGNHPQVCTFSSILGNDGVNVIQARFGTYVNILKNNY